MAVFRWHLFVRGLLFPLLWATNGLAWQSPNPLWSIRFPYSFGDASQAHTGAIKNVLLRQQGQQLLSCSTDGVVCLWDLESQRIIRRFVDPESEIVWCIDTTADEKTLITAGKGGHLYLWDIESGKMLSKRNAAPNVYSISVLGDDHSFLAADDRGFVTRWSVDSEKPVSEWRICSGDVTALAVAADNSVFATGNDDGEVRLWRIPAPAGVATGDDPEAKMEFVGLGTWVCCLKLSENGTELLGCDYSGNVALWNVRTGKQIWMKEEVAGDISWVDFVDDRSVVAVDTSDRIHRFDRQTGGDSALSVVLPELAGFVLSADRKIAWCGGSVVPCAFEIESGKRVFPPDEMFRAAQKVNAIALYGKHLFWSSGKFPLSVRNVETDTVPFQVVLPDPDHWESSQMLATSDGVVLCNRESALLIEPGTGAIIDSRQVIAGDWTVADVGTRLVLKPEDGNVELLQLAFGTPGKGSRFALGEESIESVRLLDEHHLLTGYPDHLFSIWSLDERSMLSRQEIPATGRILDATAVAIAFEVSGDLPAVYFAEIATATGVHQLPLAQLIDELESDRFEVREKATRMLADGGPETLRLFEGIEAQSVEQAVRLQRVKKLIGSRQMPDLGRRAKWIDAGARNLETICIDRQARFILATTRNGWRSDLLIYQFAVDGIRLDSRIPLRSRAALLQRSVESDSLFIIGYAGGAVDIVEVGQRR
jgi:WD40 repeat protein